ncbi:MAG: DNA-3-methyladenine glycosylase I [Gammaproteobacteria bacterium]|nr:DNA-3-methyladenine glycosylase I [Gammaproteobacteria bacterium]MBU2059007.1 DNA-3-methyladenine glycosylase I [Gammaproteobacteria bacterium]MBU2174770.1 DNA-3-methyladenine glycosylase I [Gammaproteobacteria bacterium]MBU2245783.1 DNA-3-methyladenine glycosylase I [Gammaproteobacteria bacterium]MBU2393805.1 DNA-3-methyladenine glycosylase I [Gammaproteobacteria bacterium]
MSYAESFAVIFHRAAERKGGKAALQALLSKPRTAAQLSQLTDAECLSEFSKKIFQSGFVWSVVEKKWPGFEEIFFGFEPEKMLLMSDEMLAAKATDPRIIRNATKVFAIRDNALMIQQVADQYGSFGAFLAQWPGEDIIGLWGYLKKHGCRLGGNTGAYALRMLGKDTFIISQDLEAYLRNFAVIEGGLTSQKNQKAIQQQFNLWQQESGLSLQEISKVVAFSFGDNHVGLKM